MKVFSKLLMNPTSVSIALATAIVSPTVTDIHLFFYILKGSVSQSAPVLLYVTTIQDVEEHL